MLAGEEMIRLHYFLRPLALTSFIVLNGCAVGPDYSLPRFDLPSLWHEDKPAASVESNGSAWWADFDDPAMTNLIERAMANNENLAIAAARITEVLSLIHI